MTLPLPSSDNVLNIYLTLSQYPILGHRIRSRMRKELFERGIISQDDFETEARHKAVESQGREGLQNPYGEESSEIWERRLSRIRNSLTDFYFAYNLPYTDFERIVREILTERGRVDLDFVWFNPELAPQDMLFEQAEMIAHMPEEERAKFRPRLQEIKVVLIRTMVSDQLRYIKIARQWFKVADLVEIRNRKIGGGKVGGKAAGMLLALRILKETAPPELRDSFKIPESFFLGSDVFYNFMSLNGLMHWNDQKYKSEEQIRADYPIIVSEFSKGQFPPEIVERLKELVRKAGETPLIVRSSSLLEDNFGTSFAGKYDSIFCPNQGSLDKSVCTDQCHFPRLCQQCQPECAHCTVTRIIWQTMMNGLRSLSNMWKGKSLDVITCRRVRESLSAAICTAGLHRSARKTVSCGWYGGWVPVL